MMQTDRCLYCGRPWLDSSCTCRYSDCPSKQVQMYTYCGNIPCPKLTELAAEVERLQGKVGILDSMLMVHNHDHSLTHEPQYLMKETRPECPPPQLKPPAKSDEELVEKYAKQLIDWHGMPGEPREWELRDILRDLIKETRGL